MADSSPSAKKGKKGIRIKSTAKVTKKAKEGDFKTGRWTRDEHFRFLAALKMFGKEWKNVQLHVGTRTSTQARSHAQKFFNKLEKRNTTLEQYLETLDLDNIEKNCIMSDLEDEKYMEVDQIV
jgi:SHAQKYF class myb-like DNA-binding protein